MAYLDGELTAASAAEAAAHLEQCPDCRKLAAELREVSDTLMAWDVEKAELEPRRNVAEALQKRASEKSPSPAAWTWRKMINPLHWPKPAWGLTAAVAVLVILSIVTKYQPLKMAKMVSAPETLAKGQVAAKLAAPKTEFRNGRGGAAFSVDGNLNGDLAPPPSGAPRPGTGAIRLDEIQSEEQENAEDQGNAPNVPALNGPMIIRTAELELTTEQFDKARSSVEEILKRHRGYVGELNVSTPSGSARSLTGTLRVPAGQLDATLSDLKGLGRTEKESQGGEEVTQQYVDLEARLANARHTEQRLTDILRQRTGKLSDVLAVEMQISRVRGEIEQMEAQRKTMKNQVDYATLTVTVTEAYKAELKAVPPSTGTQFRNAAVEGYRSLVDGIIAVLLWLLSVGPTLLLWGTILLLPARMMWKKLRPRLAKQQ